MLYSFLRLSRRQIILLLVAIGFNCIAYNGGRLIAKSFEHVDMTTALDEMLPFISCTILIYWACYLFWGINYIIGVKYGENEGMRFIVAHCLAETICFIAFVTIPTTVVRADVYGDTAFDFLVRITYVLDSPDNLFPSIHCMVSWLSWIAVRKCVRIPSWYKTFSLIFAIMVCISTLTVKQHVIPDVFSGVLLAEASYLVSGLIMKKRLPNNS